MRYLPIISIMGLFYSASVNAELPIYAAFASDALSAECDSLGQINCQLNVFDGHTLTALVSSLPSSMLIEEALSVSEYEVLIGNALVNIDTSTKQAEIVLEITTTWRQLPLDDFNLRRPTTLTKVSETATEMLAEWASHLETNLILEADKIYKALGASDYAKDLALPQSIGDFVLTQSVIYRDPLLGSISRYSHPRFDSAVIDISVYPFSPYLKQGHEEATSESISNMAVTSPLQLEMKNEVAQIKQLIKQANINDYLISSVEPTVIIINGVAHEGLRLEVLMHTQTDPVYSTQYIFQQNDKVIKLTGNLPESMMNNLVNESLPKIKVPSESAFMRALRRG